MTFQRDTGILKRTNGTPLPSRVFLGARMLHALFVAVLLVVDHRRVRPDALRRRHPDRRHAAPVPGHAAGRRGRFCALGFAVTAVIPNADAAPAIVNASILPLLFLSGIFIPFGSNAPAWILWIARIFPVRHFADGHAGRLPRHAVPLDRRAVSWLPGASAACCFAVRFFSWEPRS